MFSGSDRLHHTTDHADEVTLAAVTPERSLQRPIAVTIYIGRPTRSAWCTGPADLPPCMMTLESPHGLVHGAKIRFRSRCCAAAG